MTTKTETRYRSTFYFNGKRYEATGKNQREADQKAALKRDKLVRGEAGISGDMTVERWAKEWLETYKKPKIGEGQYYNYTLYLGVINSEIGSQKLKSVKDMQLQKILNNRAGKSKSDVTRLRMTIKALFDRAHKSRLIAYNPSGDLELPKCAESTRRSITNDERTAILSLAETHPAGLWIKIMLYCGLRPGECRALDWKHVDVEKKLIHVLQSVKAVTENIGAPKSAAGVRDVPIPDIFIDALVAAKKDNDSPVLVQFSTGRRYTKQGAAVLWRNFIRHLDIKMGAKLYRNKIIESMVAPDLVPYCLRHTYCTDLEVAGVPINVARYLMGHSDISVTSKIYTHTNEKAVQEAAKKINLVVNVVE